MKKSKVKFNYINNRLAAGALMATLLTTSLTGCSFSNEFRYDKDKYGTVLNVTGEIKYNYLKGCYFTVVEDQNFGITDCYITKRYIDDPTLVVNRQKYCYKNILTNKVVFERKIDLDNGNYADEKNNKFLLAEIKLEDHLYDLEKIQDNYTAEDVEQILEQMKEKYFKQNNQQLVKGK